MPGIRRISRAALPREHVEKIAVVPQELFSVGEYYKFQLRWVGIPVGFASFQISGEDKISNRDVFVVTVKAYTNKFASKIYNVKDVFTSYIDKERFIPLRYDVNRKDGNYRKNAVTYFDHEKGIAYFENFVDGSKKTYAIPHGILDPVSTVLKVRTLDIEVGKDYTFHVMNNEQVYELHAPIERREFIRLKDFGDFDAYFLSPYAILKGKVVKKGKVSGYISCDRKRILLYAVAKAPIFTTITATLVDHSQ